MNKISEKQNYIWLDCNSRLLYLHECDRCLIEIFSELIIKEIKLFVTYDIHNKYNTCFSKLDSNIKLNESELFRSNKNVKFFFEYFQNKELNCAEFEIHLVDGTILKTFYGNDLIVFTENIIHFNQICELIPTKLRHYFSENKYFKGNLIQYTNDAIIRLTPILDIEEFLFCNESYFFNNL